MGQTETRITWPLSRRSLRRLSRMSRVGLMFRLEACCFFSLRLLPPWRPAQAGRRRRRGAAGRRGRRLYDRSDRPSVSWRVILLRAGVVVARHSLTRVLIPAAVSSVKQYRHLVAADLTVSAHRGHICHRAGSVHTTNTIQMNPITPKTVPMKNHRVPLRPESRAIRAEPTAHPSHTATVNSKVLSTPLWPSLHPDCTNRDVQLQIRHIHRLISDRIDDRDDAEPIRSRFGCAS
jgi:hypothetical protein